MTAQEAKAKNRGLGRGLSALFEDDENFSGPAAALTPSVTALPERSEPGAARAGGRVLLAIDLLYGNEGQPRHRFDDEQLQSLADSIAEHGIIQPILVREKISPRGRYQIVAGERRWRAAQRVNLHEVPVHIVDLSDEETLEVALIENLQREDLNPVEEARGYQRLLAEHNRTQDEIAKRLGKSRPHVANMVRLLNLPPAVLDHLEKGALSIGHARALVPAANAELLAQEILARGLNVRQTEALVAAAAANPRKTTRALKVKDVDTLALEQDITNLLGMKVSINSRDGKNGTLQIEFKSLDQLDDLMQRLSNAPRVMLPD